MFNIFINQYKTWTGIWVYKCIISCLTRIYTWCLSVWPLSRKIPKQVTNWVIDYLIYDVLSIQVWIYIFFSWFQTYIDLFYCNCRVVMHQYCWMTRRHLPGRRRRSRTTTQLEGLKWLTRLNQQWNKFVQLLFPVLIYLPSLQGIVLSLSVYIQILYFSKYEIR